MGVTNNFKPLISWLGEPRLGHDGIVSQFVNHGVFIGKIGNKNPRYLVQPSSCVTGASPFQRYLEVDEKNVIHPELFNNVSPLDSFDPMI